MIERRFRRWLLATLSLSGCAGSSPAAALHTAVLPPAGGGEAFEPTIAIDPADPDRLLAAAMYGVPFARGGTGIWVWRSGDGGQTWTDGQLDPPRLPGVEVEPTFAADVIAGFDLEGTQLLASMSDAPPLGGTFLSRLAPDGSGSGTVGVYRNTVDSAAGQRVLHDKPWMVVDRGAASPHRGSVYLSVGAVTAGLGAAGPGIDWALRGSAILLAASRDGGRTFSTPRVVADSMSFNGYLAVSSSGALDLIYTHLRNKDGGADAIFHRRSTDGGDTFGPQVTIVALTGDTLLELPVLATRPDGSALVCWAQSPWTDERTNRIRCAARAASGEWQPPQDLRVPVPPGVVAGWPAVAGTARGWYLLLYLVGVDRTEVALYRSHDGSSFSKLATLATADSLGIDRFCVVGATACRRTRTDGFAIGDYVTLSAGGGRLAATYVLPRPGSQQAAIYVTTLAEP